MNDWTFSAETDGDDIVVSNTTATWFGGDSDPLDNGETASGTMTKRNPFCMGCALPMLPQVKSTADSPIPKVPWGTLVEVTGNGKTIVIPVIDNGPACSAGDGIDLTVHAFKALGVSLKTGVVKVSYRILGGAQYV
jgi:hypothetical protein